MEGLIAAFLPVLSRVWKSSSTTHFITRNADFEVEEDRDERTAGARAKLARRRFGSPVRLEIASMTGRMLELLLRPNSTCIPVMSSREMPGCSTYRRSMADLRRGPPDA